MNWIDEANKQLEEQRAKFQESLDNGDAAARKRSAAAVNGGKATGKIHKESGHIQKLNDYPRAEGQRREAGKLGGAKNVETGWAEEFQRIGTAKATAKLMVKKLDEIEVLHNTMESDKLYSYANLVTIVTHVKDRRLWVLLRCEEARPYIKIEKQGSFTFYKKIET